ncbi:hypothetical protein BT96DRAFT_1001050 [Gymnopus androsaceus JB14]|uniref:Uncharacterized protein n=1 Tax=Gymnopus androsaceus JB14 TaxID=1447944 RepID=A0A6A4H138_9AGAR|nr:hypothetical protein BT96DRAFT_1002374 [Gymnopus androsaceus JB14]KAE9391751.1 hypothetical protein BT96DRAFT_1001050 [Gymnopus androsaceus JB14]
MRKGEISEEWSAELGASVTLALFSRFHLSVLNLFVHETDTILRSIFALFSLIWKANGLSLKPDEIDGDSEYSGATLAELPIWLLQQLLEAMVPFTPSLSMLDEPLKLTLLT